MNKKLPSPKFLNTLFILSVGLHFTLPIKQLIGLQDTKQSEYLLSKILNINYKSKGKKERGRLLRQNYILELQKKGIKISPIGSIWAKTENNLFVAIPVASMEWRPGRWFLGLPEDILRERMTKTRVVVILLCQSTNKETRDFVFPPDLISHITNNLSKSKGQLKFNIKTTGSRYYLVLKNTGDVDISEYKGKISVLSSK